MGYRRFSPKMPLLNASHACSHASAGHGGRPLGISYAILSASGVLLETWAQGGDDCGAKGCR